MLVQEVPIEDIDLIVQLGQEFANELPEMSKYNPSIASSNIKNLVEAGIGKLYGIKKDNKYVGMLFALYFNDIFTGVYTAQEVAWYVHKDYRKYGLKLLKVFEEDCINSGVQVVAMCQLVNSMPAKVGALYTRLGYTKQDVLYRKEL